jgi:hypothetical protein
MLNQFSNLSCYEEFEIQSALMGISKVDALKEIGHKINDYYFFISEDGIFNWYDLNGNYVKDPGILKELKNKHIHDNIIKCIIPNSVTSIGNNAFYNCKSLKEITIPNSVTRIGNITFAKCNSLTSIIIPNSVTSIGYYAFYKCKSLKEITIPNSVTHIDEWVFSYCDALKEVTFKGKTLEEVKQMKNYHFGITDETIFKFS